MFSVAQLSETILRPVLKLKRLTAAAALISLAGCTGTMLSSAGPSANAIVTAAPDYSLIDINAQTIGASKRMADAVATPQIALAQVPDIQLVPGDVLRIMISDSGQEGAVFAPLASGGTVFENVRLDSRGKISLPYLGQKELSGYTLPKVEEVLRKSLKGIATDPQVHVELTGDRSGSVLVAGAVKAPGRFSALEGPLTLLDAINRAGGPMMEPHLTKVVLRTGTNVYTFNYEELLGGKNQSVPPNSEIIVERARKRFVAMGAVTQPGLHDLPSNNPSLLEVLGVAGGLKETAADASGVFIFRLTEPTETANGSVSTAEVFRLNMKDPAAIFLARQFLVLPEDAVYVTNAAVYEWQKIITPIVQVLVLGRTVNAGI
ncbi:polysaccharide biosynthesis/export family protein [Alcaligenaceae bacterium A4P071]|nr:polysaccharide biosynthesis/export family protein [Alcaligenaceae bacterium A4P071]